MEHSKHYVIRGGIEGRERLRVLARVMHPGTIFLFDRLDLRDGLTCLDVGCGGGDVTLDLGRRVAPHGKVVGTDIDPVTLAIARREAQQQGITNVEFRLSDVRDGFETSEYDRVYARFLLTHLRDPAGTVKAFYQCLRPQGRIAIEDIDFSGYFTYPESKAFRRYHELYCAVVRRRGGDPNLGPRLPLFLRDSGFEDIGVSVVQPLGIEGEVKLMNPITMENIADAILEDDLTTREEIEDVIRELYAFAADHGTVAGVPRVVQAWGQRPTA